MPFAEPGVEPHYGPSRTIEIAHLSVRLEIDPAGRSFQGEASIQVRALPTYKGELWFDLDDVAVDSVVSTDAPDLTWEHVDARLRLRAASCPTSVTVRWHGTNPFRGMYFTGPEPWAPDRQHMAWTQCQDEDAHFILPCHDHPSVKHPWSVELWGPAGYTLLSNGTLAESGERDGRAFARYEQRDPMPAYLFTAVCAKLSAIEAAPVHFGDRTVAVRYLVPVGEEEAVERSMGKTPQMIETFSRLTGVDYPWPRYDQVVVHDFVFGGMENIGCTTMIDSLLVDPRTPAEWDPDALVSHELAHQWFGDLVTCQDWSQGWLNESWATFMEFAWWEHDRSTADATWFRWENFETYLEEVGGRYRRPIVSYEFREPIDVFDRHLYEKGGLVLSALRYELGTDAFWSGVNRYLLRHRYETVHTRHFQRALEEATGTNLDRFFHQWLHSPGHPALKIKLRAEDGLLSASICQTQTGEGVPQVYALTVRLEIQFEGGESKSVDLRVAERERTWAVPVEKRIATVRVDPGFRAFADIALDAPEGWLRALLADPCPVLGWRAARALLEHDSATASKAVIDALTTAPHHATRARIATALGERGGDVARDALLEALKTETHVVVRRAIAEGLGCFRDALAADALIAILEGPAATWQLHGSALVALGKTRDPRAIERISRHLDVESWSDHVRQRAMAGLASAEDPAALDVLIERSRASQPDRVRGAAANALAKLGDRVEGVRRRVVERLVEMLTEPGFRSQLSAIDGLASLRDPSSLAALSRVHQSAPDGRTRRHAYEASVRIRAGRTTEDGLATLRRSLEKMTEEGHKLRDRVDRLERPRS
jgi:aminopeptidase N